MSGRIWPGARCEIISVNKTEPQRLGDALRYLGRIVVAVDRYDDGFWSTSPLLVAGDGAIGYPHETELRPILPPPASDTTDDTAPVECGIAHA